MATDSPPSSSATAYEKSVRVPETGDSTACEALDYCALADLAPEGGHRWRCRSERCSRSSKRTRRGSRTFVVKSDGSESRTVRGERMRRARASSPAELDSTVIPRTCPSEMCVVAHVIARRGRDGSRAPSTCGSASESIPRGWGDGDTEYHIPPRPPRQCH